MVQHKILSGSIHPFTVLNAMRYPRTILASFNRADAVPSRVYYAQLERALSCARRAGSAYFMIVPIAGPHEYDGKAMNLLTQLGFAGGSAEVKENLRVLQLRRWVTSLLPKERIVVRVEDPLTHYGRERCRSPF